MAIMGFLVHCQDGCSERLEKAVAAMPGMTTCGVHQGSYVVAVAEAPSEEMEGVLNGVHELAGVLAAYVTSLTMEDEWE